jgi:hypothetical protein
VINSGSGSGILRLRRKIPLLLNKILRALRRLAAVRRLFQGMFWQINLF